MVFNKIKSELDAELYELHIHIFQLFFIQIHFQFFSKNMQFKFSNLFH